MPGRKYDDACIAFLCCRCRNRRIDLGKELVENVEGRDHLELSEVETIAWAELYETEHDALRK